MKAKSLVKVQVEGQDESDFLPLFYHPKAQYWDDTDVLATDFDEESGYFKRAWMSFRCGDEVVVMIREGSPFAVLGFADGVPRVGEDILQLEALSSIRWQQSKGEKYESESGPDGAPLSLTVKAELIVEQESPPQQIDKKTIYFKQTQTLNSTQEDFDILTPYVNHTIGTHKYFTISTVQNYTNQTLYSHSKAQLHLLSVGPILFMLVATFKSKLTTSNEDFTEDCGTSDEGSCTTSDTAQWPYYPEPVWEHFDSCPGIEAALAAMVAGGTYEEHYDEFNTNISDVSVDFAVYAAIYKKELYDEVKGNPPTYDFLYNTINGIPGDFIGQAWGADLFGEQLMTNGSGVTYRAHPHTEAELQAAGMWPAE